MNRKHFACTIDGCTGIHKANGFCNAHYLRLKQYGTLELKYAKRGAPKAWLQAHIHHCDDSCLIWPFSTNGSGYGQLQLGRKRPELAHRVMCHWAHGEPPFEKAEAAHSCGNGHKGCVNPRHLSWKDHAANMADMVAHNRSQRGEKSYFAKLTESQVKLIRTDRRVQSEIARDFGISRANVSVIKSGKSWSYLDAAPGISPEPHKTKWAD